MKPTKILIFDDTDKLKPVLEQAYNVLVVGITNDESELIDFLDASDAEMVFVNISDSRSTRIVKEQMAACPYLNIVVLSMYCNNEHLKIMLFYGLKHHTAEHHELASENDDVDLF